MKQKEKEFILALEALTRKYGLAVHGCGCCGTPTLIEVEVQPESGYAPVQGDTDEITWVSPSDEWKWKNYGALIIKETTDCEPTVSSQD